MAELTAKAFVESLRAQQSAAERAKIERYFKGDDGSVVIGVRMKHVFDTAKACQAMPLDEVEALLESPYYEARLGAVSILDFQVRRKTITEMDRRARYELYLRRHDRINNWDLVDRAAPRVIGWYLLDKPRRPLFELAESSSIWERRTAITASFWLIRQGDIDDALALADKLLADPEELINKSVGTALREIGKIDPARLVAFLHEHAARIPRVTLRYAIERFSPAERSALLGR
ncbi:3-methyladenine DNA glycosylase AlkD [Tamaricihabitans halophyticus]|uniref:3-methyladenine DNA glycosylase AlkD n=1 Tax=Tamaricihabitans halophyticus TaxID=1262583 RepID=A0A4R2QKJ2_9PSEU|nr:DNA alkylation repair protein [Tamaricihabitans halophyticus]TCP49960.1 3-methyladenine DNA glycosylase AlkD [Tamaricihabitans halophyticus]